MLLYYTCPPTRVDTKDDPCLLRDIEGLASGNAYAISVKTQVQTDGRTYEEEQVGIMETLYWKVLVYIFVMILLGILIFSIQKYRDYKKTNKKDQRDAD